MAAAAFVFVTILISIHVETMVGSIGVLAPVAALAVFYFSTSFGWRAGAVAGILAGTAVDAVYGRAFFATPLEMMAVVALSRIWLHQGDPSSLFPNLIPGAAAAVVVSFPQLAWSVWTSRDFQRDALLLAFAAGFGAFALPLMIQILDFLAGKLALPKYKTARAEAKSGS